MKPPVNECPASRRLFWHYELESTNQMGNKFLRLKQVNTPAKQPNLEMTASHLGVVDPPTSFHVITKRGLRVDILSSE